MTGRRRPGCAKGRPSFTHCGLVALAKLRNGARGFGMILALWYPDYVEIVECNPKVDEAGFIIGWEVPDL